MVKIKLTQQQATKSQSGIRGIALLFFNLGARWGVGGQRHAPAVFYPRGRPGTHCIGDWVGPQARSGRVRKISPPSAFDPRIVQPVASRYTD